MENEDGHSEWLNSACRLCLKPTCLPKIKVITAMKALHTAIKSYYFPNEQTEIHPVFLCIACHRELQKESKEFIKRQKRLESMNIESYLEEIGGYENLKVKPKHFQLHSEMCPCLQQGVEGNLQGNIEEDEQGDQDVGMENLEAVVHQGQQEDPPAAEAIDEVIMEEQESDSEQMAAGAVELELVVEEHEAVEVDEGNEDQQVGEAHDDRMDIEERVVHEGQHEESQDQHQIDAMDTNDDRNEFVDLHLQGSDTEIGRAHV